MIRYEVTLECSVDTAPALERWMRNTHIPEILATGCFTTIHLDRSDGRFRTVYHAASQPDLDRYLDQHAPQMRNAFQHQFPSGVAVSRDVWEQVQSWPSM